MLTRQPIKINDEENICRFHGRLYIAENRARRERPGKQSFAIFSTVRVLTPENCLLAQVRKESLILVLQSVLIIQD